MHIQAQYVGIFVINLNRTYCRLVTETSIRTEDEASRAAHSLPVTTVEPGYTTQKLLQSPIISQASRHFDSLQILVYFIDYHWLRFSYYYGTAFYYYSYITGTLRSKALGWLDRSSLQLYNFKINLKL